MFKFLTPEVGYRKYASGMWTMIFLLLGLIAVSYLKASTDIYLIFASGVVGGNATYIYGNYKSAEVNATLPDNNTVTK